MSRVRGRVTLAGLFLALFLAGVGFNLWQRSTSTAIRVTATNGTDADQILRVIDASSGRGLGTFLLAAGSTALLVDHRLDTWWRDLTAEEQASGLAESVVLELYGPSGCELADQQGVGGSSGRTEHFTLLREGGITIVMTDRPSVVEPSAAAPAPLIDDPCAGGPAPPLGVITNRTSVPILIAGRVVVEPCASLSLHAGDLARPLPTAATAGATAVAVRSLAVQQERWPMEPRTVIVTRSEVWDETGSWSADDIAAGCGGVPAPDETADSPEEGG